MKFVKFSRTKRPMQRSLYIGLSLAIAAAGLIPLLVPRGASASQLTSRSLTLSSGVPSATATKWTYGFTYVSSASAIQSVKFVVCTTAVGTYGLASTSSTAGCSAPATGNLVNQGAQFGTLGGSWTNTTAFTRDTSTIGNCAPANNVLCITRTQAAAESAAAKTITWDTQTNPSTANTAFFVGIYLYSATGYTSPTDSGTVASAVVQTLTINAAVAEVLNFCVGSTTIDDATSSIASDCTGVSGTSINIGTLDTSAVNVSPVSTNGGDNKNGAAMIRTNAANGATISYDAIQQSGTNHQGTLRISGATCNAGSVSTDQCIDAAGASQTAFSAGTEKFGMSVGAINCGSTTSYTCTFSSGTYNLVRDANYDCTGNNTFSTTCSQGYAWVESGTATQIASSTSSTTKVIDDEALLLKFAATPAITTPFGAYTAQSDFIAIATY